MEKVLPIKRKGVKVAGPMVEKMMKIPMPKDNVFDDIEYVMDKMGRLQKLMLNKDIVSLRIVTTPEKIVIQEAKRNFTCLYLYNYNVDAILVNRIYPDMAMEGYFNKWIILQQEGLKDIRESFSEVPKFYVELQNEELRTLNVLKRVGEKIYGNNDPNDVLFKKEIYQIEKQEGNIKLTIYLPFSSKDEMELKQNENELLIGIRNEIRRYPLPLELQNKEIKGAKLEEGYLIINF